MKVTNVISALRSATILAILGLMTPTAASAMVFDFSYTDTSSPTTTFGSGTFTTSSLSSPYTITGITGSESYEGVSDTINGPSSYAGADNHLFMPPPYVDFGGISFETTSHGAFNLYYDGSYWVLSEKNNNPVGYPDGLHEISFQVSAVPEPATWAMMLLGFSALGFLAYRKRLGVLRLA